MKFDHVPDWFKAKLAEVFNERPGCFVFRCNHCAREACLYEGRVDVFYEVFQRPCTSCGTNEKTIVGGFGEQYEL